VGLSSISSLVDRLTKNNCYYEEVGHDSVTFTCLISGELNHIITLPLANDRGIPILAILM
jgi:hypothetical protein